MAGSILGLSSSFTKHMGAVKKQRGKLPNFQIGWYRGEILRPYN